MANDPFGNDFYTRQYGAPTGMTPEQLQAFTQGLSNYQNRSGGGRSDAWNAGMMPSYDSPLSAGMNAMPRTGGAGGGNGGQQPFGGYGAQGAYADTEGRAATLMNDPSIRAAQDYLRGVVGGQNLPFSEASMNAMRAQYGRSTASAEGSQMGQIRDSLQGTGGSIYDPAYQAAGREAESTRMGRNLDYAGQLQAQASQANFAGQMQGASQLAGTTLSNNAQINALLGHAADYHAGEQTVMPSSQQLPSGYPSVSMPSYQGYANAESGGLPPAGAAGGGGNYNWNAPQPYSQPGPYDTGGNQAGADSYRGGGGAAPSSAGVPSGGWTGIDYSQGWPTEQVAPSAYGAKTAMAPRAPLTQTGQTQPVSPLAPPQKRMTTYSTRRTA